MQKTEQGEQNFFGDREDVASVREDAAADREEAIDVREDLDVSRRVMGGEADLDVPRQPLTGKAATQERILVAATDLFLNRGYETTTIAQVAERASVSRATVFWHFSGKESLFRECFNRICEPYRVSLARDFSSLPPEKRLEEQVELYQSFVAEYRADVGGLIRWAETRQTSVRTILEMIPRRSPNRF